MKPWLRIFLPLSLLLALGFLRDFVFLNINDQLYKLYYGNYEFELPASLKSLENLSYMSLYYLKYFLTGFFVVAYAGLTHWGLKVCLPAKANWKITAMVFMFIFVFAALIFGVGNLLGEENQAYLTARGILGVLQSPVPFMILFPGLLLKKTD
jgi:hypothetical protein